MAEPIEPAPAVRDAATLVLVRDGAHGLEVLMCERARRMRFGAGMHVFPGGAVDAADRRMAARLEAPALSDAAASRALGVERGGLAFWLAAIRECFEECGLLLAPGVGAEQTGRCRVDLLSGASFFDLCRREALVPAVETLAYLSHWITPPGYSRRFSTRFFIAQAPPGQIASVDGSEIVACRWLSPARALEDHADERMAMMVPTRKQLEALAEQPDAAAAVAAARAQTRVETVAPASRAEARAYRRP